MASPRCPRGAPQSSESTTRWFSSNWGSTRPPSTACGRAAPSRQRNRSAHSVAALAIDPAAAVKRADPREIIAAQKGVTMSVNPPIHRIAVVGTGVIGASWAAYYLAHGFDVVATDPAPNAEANLRQYVDTAWPALARVGLTAGASRERLTFNPQMDRAL